MAFHFGNTVVTDGLVMYLDAANRRSYPGSGTIWRDLINTTSTGVLTNGPVFDGTDGGSILFDNLDDRVIIPPSPQINNLSQNKITVSSWAFVTAAGSNRRTIAQKRVTEGGWILSLRPDINTVRAFVIATGWNVGDALTEASPATPTNFIGRWNNFSMTYDIAGDRRIKIYINGVEGNYILQPVNPIPSDSDEAGDLFIGWGVSLPNPTTVFPFGGKIAQVSIYNRVLSASEILQNYNALKSRYGLT